MLENAAGLKKSAVGTVCAAHGHDSNARQHHIQRASQRDVRFKEAKESTPSWW
jgi:hypothetical protein